MRTTALGWSPPYAVRSIRSFQRAAPDHEVLAVTDDVDEAGRLQLL